MIALAIALALAGEPSPGVDQVPAHQDGRVQPMDHRGFWAIVDRTAAFEADPERQLEALRGELEAMPAEEVLAFGRAFDAQLARAYTWDLWAIASIVHGGASDDGFEYFRRWMVSKGSATFEALLADPDSLPDLLVEDVSGVLEFEEFPYVVAEVWSAKTGQDSGAMPADLWFATMGVEPRGEPFADDPEQLERRFPRTWARFGNRPLG